MKMLIKNKNLFLEYNSELNNIIEEIIKLNFIYKINKTLCYFLFHIILIIVCQNNNNINMCTELFLSFHNSKTIIKQELIENLNKFNMSSIKSIDNKNIEDAITETTKFFLFFYLKKNLRLAISLIHEVIFNLITIDKNISPNNICIIYKIFMKEINYCFYNEKLKKEDYYMKIIEICNLSIKMINEWINVKSSINF